MEMDAAAYVVFWVLTQHVPEADTGFKSPLPMLPALEDNAWLKADNHLCLFRNQVEAGQLVRVAQGKYSKNRET